MTIGLVPIDRVLAELDELEEVLRMWGLHQKRDRLSKAKDALARLMRLIDEGRGREILNQVDLWWASAEALEFCMIHRFLRPMDEAELREKFRKALKGPLNPINENSDRTNKGRNTVFELFVGGAFRSVGAAVTFENPADVTLSLSSGRVFVECKRPFKENGIPRNLNGAYNQGLTRLASEAAPHDVAVVALSFSRVLLVKLVEHGLMPPSFRDENSLQALGKAVERALVGSWRDETMPDARLVAGLAHALIPVWVESHGCIVAARVSRPIVRRHCMRAVLPDGGQEFIEYLSAALKQ